jgi:hypothetical protein
MTGLPTLLSRHPFFLPFDVYQFNVQTIMLCQSLVSANLRSEFIGFRLHMVSQHRNNYPSLRPRGSPPLRFDIVSFSSKFAHIYLIFAFDLRSLFSFFLHPPTSHTATPCVPPLLRRQYCKRASQPRSLDRLYLCSNEQLLNHER